MAKAMLTQNGLPRKPGTRKSPADQWITDRIGPRRNGRNEGGPRFVCTATAEDMRAMGKVNVPGIGWLPREYCSPSQLAELDARDASDNGNAERREILRQMAEEMEDSRRDRCAYCGAPDGACSH